jgi:hypothetical protein
LASLAAAGSHSIAFSTSAKSTAKPQHIDHLYMTTRIDSWSPSLLCYLGFAMGMASTIRAAMCWRDGDCAISYLVEVRQRRDWRFVKTRTIVREHAIVCDDKDNDSKIRTGDEGTIWRTRRRQQAKEGGNVADAKGREHGNTDPYVLRFPRHTNPTFSNVTFAPHLRHRRTRNLAL